tara:strand:+ start:465 stop:857 length:393 start_codon:yes stop_codon:yes gene_type:complete
MNKKKLKELLLLIGSTILWSPMLVLTALFFIFAFIMKFIVAPILNPLSPYLYKLFLFVYGTKESKRRTPLKRISIAVLIIILIIIFLEWNWRTSCEIEYQTFMEIVPHQKWCGPLDSDWYRIRTFVLDLF